MKLAAVLLLSALSVSAQAGSSLPETLKVQLFSADAITSATIAPANSKSTYKTCAKCTALSVTTPLSLTLLRDTLEINNSQHTAKLELRGSFYLSAKDHNAQATGTLEVSIANGSLFILVTMTLEQYVEAAVNGEASADEPPESLKAMAIVARTFATLNQHRHAKEGFDLCDSTHCEALKSTAIRASVRQAVAETAGETLWYGAARAQGFTSQHCGGQTESASAAWQGKDLPYLPAHHDEFCLRRSSAAWHAELRTADLETVLKEQHWSVPVPVLTAAVSQRTPSGRARLLRFAGSGRSALVSAASFRLAVGRRFGWNLLRSDWYDVETQGDHLVFTGKGFGHGVGLCQAGAHEMAKEGRTSQQILAFYFPGTHAGLGSIDNGWQTTQASGWTLISTNSAGSWLEDGNEAWARARSLLPSAAASRPIVRIAPSAEMFRHLTGRPGWLLAATDGQLITVQPAIIVTAHAGSATVLLHEFLHVLVEAEAAPNAPLWLREGLVETLAQGIAPRTAPDVRTGLLESELLNPATQAESQLAHAAAWRKVSQLVQHYRSSRVQSWLKSGVPQEALAQTD